MDVLFFFSSRRRHTRSLCDWSSDVCSSDLEWLMRLLDPLIVISAGVIAYRMYLGAWLLPDRYMFAIVRSEERRVGKEWRYRWWPDREGKKSRRYERGAATRSAAQCETGDVS